MIDGSSSSKMCQQQSQQQQQNNSNKTSANATTPGGSFSDVAANTTANTTNCSSPREVTVKPKPIKRHVDNQTNYPPMPSYSFNSPKNPNGLLPFQPTGELLFFYRPQF